MRLPVPVTIVTGCLGVGKSTFITQLAKHRPPQERWAIVVNEFGALGIDGALLSGSSDTTSGNSSEVVVREIAGGCLCCVAAGLLPIALAQLLRQTKPDRLIIEPSGLGHPAGLLQTLQTGPLAPSVHVHAVICLVDVRDPQGMQRGPAGEDQVNVADVVVGSKADLATPEEQAGFLAWAEQLWPPKQQVHHSTSAVLQDPVVDLLEMTRQPVFTPLIAPATRQRGSKARGRQGKAESIAGGEADAGTTLQTESNTIDSFTSPSTREVVRYATRGADQHAAHGWLFHDGDVFNKQRVLEGLHRLVANPGVIRLKAVFRFGAKSWHSINWVRSTDISQSIETVATAYTKDSRLEVIVQVDAKLTVADTLFDSADAGANSPELRWVDALEAHLIGCVEN